MRDLRPAISLVLAKVRTGKSPAHLLAALVKELRDLLKVRRGSGKRMLVADLPLEQFSRSLEVEGFIYREARPPSWQSGQGETQLEDLFHQLVLVCCRERYVGFHATEPVANDRIWRQLEVATVEGFSRLEPIDVSVLHAAFLEGPTRTLWLNSVHPTVATRADSKILSGVELKDALDPLGDQGYYFTAARVSSTLLKKKSRARSAIGTTPRRSKIWAGRSRDWGEFADGTTVILEHLRNVDRSARRNMAPLPVLANPVASLQGVADAFDVSVQPPELLAEPGDIEPRLLELAQRWAYDGSFEVSQAAGANLTATLKLYGQDVAEVKIDVRQATGQRIALTVVPRQLTVDGTLYREALWVQDHHDWLAIRYDSGHTLAQGQLYAMTLRDVTFDGWEFRDFTGIDIGKEKPFQGGNRTFMPADIGTQDSLFCWIARGWPECDGRSPCRGWLACDDGEGEIADFVFFDPTAQPHPVLELVHVKAAGVTTPNRPASVSDYEIVTAQAVKNLRSLDRSNLVDALTVRMSRPIATHVWLDGARVADGRTRMIAAIRQAGQRMTKSVVIVQPRLTEGARRTALGPQGGAAAGRIRQLDTLLLTTQAECRALGASLRVVGAA
jgi:hypothetical protein